MARPAIEAEGTNGIVVFDGLVVTIKRAGRSGRRNFGNRTKVIPVQHVTAVVLKPPSFTKSGFISFTVAGALEQRRQSLLSWEKLAAADDENSVYFARSQRALFQELADAVQNAIAGQATAPAPAPPSPAGLTDELERLGDLRERGLLDDQEFEAAKRRLLGTT
jgi:hypothetical protein